MLTPELVQELSTETLQASVHTLETLDGLVGDLTDYELFVITGVELLQTAVHVIDAELRRRQIAL